MSDVRLLYQSSEEYFTTIGDYGPMIHSMGIQLVRQDDGGYHGDTRVLFASGDRYGYLCFGWGSCSGCDALQSCCSWREVQNLYDELVEDIRWFDDTHDALEFFQTHDWEGDYNYSQAFVQQCVALLGEPRVDNMAMVDDTPSGDDDKEREP